MKSKNDWLRVLCLFLFPLFSWGQDCIDPITLNNEALEVCRGTAITFCPEVGDNCAKWLPDSIFPYPEVTFYNEPTTIFLEEDVTITLITTDHNGNLIEQLAIEINVIGFEAELADFYEFCEGDQVTIEPTISGGSGNFTYAWSNGATTSAISVSAADTTFFELVITDTELECSTTLYTYVSERALPESYIIGSDYSICENGLALSLNPNTSCLNPTVTLDATTAGVESYTWSTNPTQNTPVITVDRAGEYSVTVTDSLGCSSMASYEIASCGQVNIEAKVQALNGTIAYLLEAQADAGYSFVWSNGSTATSILVSESGDYQVLATSPNGCQAKETYRVDFPCKMPLEGYTHTPDLVGLLLPEGTPIEFFPNNGQLKQLHENNTTFQATDNFGNFEGYAPNGDINNGVYTNGNSVENIPFIIQGQSLYDAQGRCVCQLYESNIQAYQIFGTSDGTDNAFSNSSVIPFPPSDPITTYEAQPAPIAFCLNPDPQTGFSNDELADLIMEEGVYKTGNANQFIDSLALVPDYLEANNYNGCYYVYDRQAQNLRIYDKGQPIVIETDPSIIKTKLESIQQGNLPVSKDYISFFDLDATQSDNIGFEFFIRQGAIVPAEGDWLAYPESDYRALAEYQVKQLYGQLSSANASLYGQGFLEQGAIIEGEFKAKESHFVKICSFYFGEFKHVVNNAEISKGLWNPDDPSHQQKLLNIWVSAAGICDQTMVEIKDLKELAVMIGKVIEDPQATIPPIYEGIANMTFDQLQSIVSTTIQSEFDSLTADTYGGQHQRTKAGTKATSTVVKMGLSGGGAAATVVSAILGHLQKFMKLIRKFETPAIKDKLENLSVGKANKFAEDFEGLSAEDIAKFEGNPGMVDAWDGVINLPLTVRTKILNLEAAQKLDAINLWTDPSVLKTKLPKIINALDGAGVDGVSIINKVKSGNFDSVDGYKDLIKKLTDPNQVRPVKQALDKADEFPNVTNDLKKFEFEDQVNKIDVDFGTLSTPEGPPYSFVDAFQFKFANTVNAVKNRITGGVNGSLAKINNVTAQNKVLQINMKQGTKDDVLALPNWDAFISGKKAEFPNVEIKIFDSVGNSPLIY